jgi:DMSO/TMAO reductase YedYZ molybdopterin-dependent catalytic subunit
LGESFSNESAYDADRFDRHLWRLKKMSGAPTRRGLLGIAAASVGGLALGGLPSRRAAAQATCTAGGVVKPTPPELFFTLGTNREMRWEAMRNRGYLVGNDLFFVRNHTCTPQIDASTWRLRIEGSGVEQPVDFTYDDIVSMDAVSRTKFIECAGNGRSFFASQQGTATSGTQWKLGAIGVAEWTGVPLWKLLVRAGLRRTAVDVMPEGLDNEVPNQGRVRRPMPIEKALHPDTLVVYAMNGQPLPPDHGFPVRMLVPGWVGIANVKWVGRIEVSTQPLFSFWNTESYRLFGDAYPDTPLLTTQQVKSALELPFPATLPARRQLVRGRSWSANGFIKEVEVSFDGGRRWINADLKTPNLPGAWVRWDVPWNPAPGSYVIKARARDSRGNVQPQSVPLNTQGYAFWAVVDHPVTVA